MRPVKKDSSLSLTMPKFGQDFFRQAYAELKRVNWPTKKQAARLSFIVLFVSIAVGAYVGILDLTFTKLMTILLAL